MVSPCRVLVGLSIAPEPAMRIRRSSPLSTRRKSHPQLTAATQPQPLPPAWGSCS